MARLPAFSEHRFIGVRASMVAYDCDDAAQFAILSELVDDGELVDTKGLQSFAPDLLAEARNRAFHLS